MRAAVLQGTKVMKVVNRQVQSPLSHEVVIKVKACGICGTDQHIYHGHPGSANVTPPMVLGHELAGEVVEIGEGVTNIRVGDHISVDPNIYCGTCEYCRSNRAHLCEHLEAIGVTRDGGMEEYCTVPSQNCYLIPGNMSFEEAALVEPLGCVLHGFKKLKLSPLSTVHIIGGGFIGQLFLQLVKQQHVSSITVTEPTEEKKDLLYQLGADRVIHPSQVETGDDVADIVIECVGKEETMEQAIALAKKGGHILLFGVAKPSSTISISPFDIFSKELVISGSFINPYTHEEAISLISQNVIKVGDLISHHFNLEEIPETMANYSLLNVSKGVISF